MTDPASLIAVDATAPPLVVIDRTTQAIAITDRAPRVLLRDTPPPPVLVQDRSTQAIAQLADVRPRVLQAGFVGPRGLPGPAGAAGATYTHTQAAASTTWTINHNLGFRPAIALLTDGGAVIEAEIGHTSVNTAVVTLSQPLAGTARCN